MEFKSIKGSIIIKNNIKCNKLGFYILLKNINRCIEIINHQKNIIKQGFKKTKKRTLI